VSIPTETDGSVDASAGLEAFAASRACFASIEGWLAGHDSSGLEHGELEQQLDVRGRELLRFHCRSEHGIGPPPHEVE